MAKMKTPAGALPDQTQHGRQRGVSAARGATPSPRAARRGAPPRMMPADATPPVPPVSEERQEPRDPVPTPVETTLTLCISASLLRQLKATAQAEGVSLAGLATELLAEGLVLRAWDSLERQVARRSDRNGMRAHGASGAHGAQAGGGRRDRPGGHGGGRRHPQRRGSNVIDDQAMFLEYVRTQERKRR